MRHAARRGVLAGLKNSSSPPAWKRQIRREILSSRKIVVLGVGNAAGGDDAAGILCAEEIEKRMRGKARGRLEILLGHETPESLTGRIRKFDPSLVLILDAAIGRYRPGTVFIAGKKEMRDDGLSSHHISLRILVEYLEKSIGCRVIVLGIQPKAMLKNSPLSTAVKKSVHKLSEYLVSIFA